MRLNYVAIMFWAYSLALAFEFVLSGWILPLICALAIGNLLARGAFQDR
jgi:hypothetical protein